jgi:hypothetical protein
MKGRALALLLLLGGGTAAADAGSDFQDRVLPLLQARCISCHGAEKQKGKLRLDSRASILKGGENGRPSCPATGEEPAHAGDPPDPSGHQDAAEGEAGGGPDRDARGLDQGGRAVG